jgi:uncharacterized protein (TIGR00661 family)
LQAKTPRKPHILIAPLDWGLGHTTRCIPLIKELLASGARVTLAGNEQQARLLSMEFPGLDLLSLPGYNIRYSRTRAGLLWAILGQTRGILRSVRREHAWLDSILHSQNVDVVVSDNRYGLYHSKIPCVFITHQLLIKTSIASWVDRLLQKKNYRYINRFTECWIPDQHTGTNLAGELSHPPQRPQIPVFYTGFLSRLKKLGGREIKDHLFISLSGPEPQRSLLEEKILTEIAHFNGSAVIVRGLPVEHKQIPSTNSIRFFNHLSADAFNEEISKADYVIARSGYSTIMDLVVTGKKSVLIPTPGQAEQEYLADHCTRKQIACSMSQKEFTLSEALKKAKNFEYNIPDANGNHLLGQFITAFLERLKTYKPDLG